MKIFIKIQEKISFTTCKALDAKFYLHTFSRHKQIQLERKKTITKPYPNKVY